MLIILATWEGEIVYEFKNSLGNTKRNFAMNKTKTDID